MAKIKLTKEKGIGEFINEFESEGEQTVEEFNNKFPNCKINGFDGKCKVEIGEYGNGFRKITIDDRDSFDHQFATVDYLIRERIGKPFILRMLCGHLIGNFRSFTSAASFLNLQKPALAKQIYQGKYKVEEYNGNT